MILAVGLLSLLLVWGAGQGPQVSLADGGHDTHTKQQEQKLHQAQQPGLDPNADTGEHPELTDPANHVGETNVSTGRVERRPGPRGRRLGGDQGTAGGGRWLLVVREADAVRLPRHPLGGDARQDPGDLGQRQRRQPVRRRDVPQHDLQLGAAELPPGGPPKDLFCSGHVLLPDGRVLIGGGTLAYGAWKGAKYLWTFNPRTNRYEQLAPMQVGRWYPSLITVSGSQS